MASSQQTARPSGGLVVARVGTGLLLLGVTLLIVRPFLIPAVWAAVVAFMTWGPYTKLGRGSGRPAIVALLFTTITALLLGVPAVLLLITVIDQSLSLVSAIQGWIEAGAPIPTWLAENRFLGPRIEGLRATELPGTEELGPQLVKVGRSLSRSVLSIAGGVAGNVFSFFATIVTLYVFYLSGDALVAYARRMLVHLFPSRPPGFLDDVGGIVRGVVLGVVGTAVIQGSLAGVGYGIFGVPYAVGLGAVTTLLSFLPGGTLLATIGATAWLASHGETGSAIGMALWGVLLVGSLDSILRPILISRSGAADIPFLLVLFGVIGGLGAFGLLGLLVGPVVLAVSFSVVSQLPDGGSAADTGAAAD